jgi:chlorobactene glucosyltransferase
MFFLYFIIIFLFIILITISVNALFGPFLATRHKLHKTPKVSLLIPARNEEKNIGKCLDHLLGQDYENIEIIVLNDNSNDNTSSIVQKYSGDYSQITLAEGTELPDGWTGKNWACQQLGKKASGEIFIFTDADTQHGPCAVSNTVAWMQKLDLGMLSSFPQQITETISEKLIVPVIDFFVYGLLMLWTTYFIKSPAFAAANGQWIAFKKQTYQKVGGHESVKNEVVEDVELNRKAKSLNIKTLTAAGTNAVYCRMYHSANEVWHGFTKNFYGLTGHNILVFLLIEFLLLSCCVLPYFIWVLYLKSFEIYLIILLNILIRAVLAIRFKHPLLISILLHPLSILYAAIIGFNSYYQFHWGYFQWKDRKISFN